MDSVPNPVGDSFGKEKHQSVEDEPKQLADQKDCQTEEKEEPTQDVHLL